MEIKIEIMDLVIGVMVVANIIGLILLSGYLKGMIDGNNSNTGDTRVL